MSFFNLADMRRGIHSMISIIMLCSVISMSAQTEMLYEIRNFESGDKVMPYRLMLPVNYDPIEEYPLIIFLHGSGERGTDNNLQLKHGGSYFAADTIRKKYPAFVLFPQCPISGSWNNSQYEFKDGKRVYSFPETIEPNDHQDLLGELIKHIATEYLLDASRIYIGGLSMGGIGTYEAVRRNPGIYAAAFPICGGANPEVAEEIDEVSWWIFHGEDDNVIPVSASTGIYNSLIEEGADAKLTVYPKVRHDSWTKAFAEPELMNWLFSKKLD